MISLLAIMAGMNAMAQEVKITLHPGWNWIGYTDTEVKSISEALGDFVPMAGDKIKSAIQNTTYNNGVWRGRLTQLIPGYGYKYYSNRTEDVEFSFALSHGIFVETTEPTDITDVSAVVGGMVTCDDGGHVLLSGVCWGTEPDPDIDSNRTKDDSGIGSYSTKLKNLSRNTTYYVRSYAVSEYGLVYGNTMAFTTDSIIHPPVGAINGTFSVNDSIQVYFSQGNLQYIGSADTPYWKFADNQWDYFGETTGQNSDSQVVDRDLFGWGTSGYPHGAVCYQPWSTSRTYGHYYVYGNNIYNLYDQTGQADWGYNAISNGGDTENIWRTLTNDEWMYVFNMRETSSGIRYAKANVNEVNGIILLPDDWDTLYYELNDTDSNDVAFSSNIITAEQWSTLEQYGAVFLPAAGYRLYGTSIYYAGASGNYWSASKCGNNGAYYAVFSDGDVNPSYNYGRSLGVSVRLVSTSSVVLSHSVTAQPNPAEGGTIEGAGTYPKGQTCTLTAMANEGYYFVNWTENDEVVSTDATYIFEVIGDRDLVANFNQN